MPLSFPRVDSRAASTHLKLNHVNTETLDSMSEALNVLDGSVLMVSHSQSFVSGFRNRALATAISKASQ
jgi:ATPase subunit of ABC transporter with duplicated ATPase domains